MGKQKRTELTTFDAVTSNPATATIRVANDPILTAIAARNGSSYAQGEAPSLPLKGLAPGDAITYQGSGWNPQGGPIVISSAGKSVGTLPAAASFTGTYTFPGFDRKAADPCSTDLTAQQDDVTRPITLGSDQGDKILFAENITLADGTTPAAGDVLCQGWNLGATRTGKWTLVTQSITGRIGSATPGSFVDQQSVDSAPNATVVPIGGSSLPAGDFLVSAPPGLPWVQQGDGDHTTVDVDGVLGPIFLKAADGHTVRLDGTAAPANPYQTLGDRLKALGAKYTVIPESGDSFDGYALSRGPLTYHTIGGSGLLASQSSVTFTGAVDARAEIFANGPVSFAVRRPSRLFHLYPRLRREPR